MYNTKISDSFLLIVFHQSYLLIHLHLLEKLRSIAYLLWQYEVQYSGKGRPKLYDCKVNVKADKHRFAREVKTYNGEGIYTELSEYGMLAA